VIQFWAQKYRGQAASIEAAVSRCIIKNGIRPKSYPAKQQYSRKVTVDGTAKDTGDIPVFLVYALYSVLGFNHQYHTSRH